MRRYFTSLPGLSLVILIVSSLSLCSCSIDLSTPRRDNAKYNYVKFYNSGGDTIPIRPRTKYSKQPSLPKGRWHYKHTTKEQQILFRSYAYASPKAVRDMYSLIDDRTMVSISDKGCDFPGAKKDAIFSCARSDDPADLLMGKYQLKLHSQMLVHNAEGRAVVTHEIGHLLDFYFFYGMGYEQIDDIMQKSPKFKKCFPPKYGVKDQWGCLPHSEVFAEQMMYFTTDYDNKYDKEISPYKVPRLINHDDMQKALNKAYIVERNIRDGKY